MNNRQKEVQQSLLNEEKKILKNIKGIYNKALEDIDAKIADLMGRQDKENLQSIIYQVDYQKSLKTQINAILDTMNTEQFENISDYLTKCYDESFIGNMYDLHGQGIPLIFPIDQEQVVEAIKMDSKINKGLYQRLGEDVTLLKKRIANNVSRGISQGSSYSEIARNIKGNSNITMNQALRIARTEGHRISQKATMDAQNKAKAKGADIVKQWDSTIDSRTRSSHQHVDGEIRELDENFSNGLSYPGDPSGTASEVVNCRCVLLQRAKWGLDEEELKVLKERAEYFEIDKTESFKDFKSKYLKISEKSNIIKNIGKINNIEDVSDFEEMTVYWEQAYKIKVDDSVTNLEFKNVKESMIGIEKVIKEFPKTQSILKEINTKNSGVMCASFKGNINFNPLYYKKGSSGLNSMIQGEKTGFHPKNTGILETGSHEMGHLLERFLIDLDNEGLDGYSKIIHWNNCTSAKKVISQACKNAKKTTEGKGLKNYQLKSQVSGYATKTDSECLAECVADYIANKENSSILTKEVWKILKERLD